MRSIINWTRLMERLGGEDIIREIMPTYIENARGRFAELTNAMRSGDCPLIASNAHALKGMARNLSLERLSDVAAQMEAAGRGNDIEKATLLFQDLSTQMNNVLAFLSRADWIEAAKVV